jgi:2-methylcitrate dehydratase PrpD
VRDESSVPIAAGLARQVIDPAYDHLATTVIERAKAAVLDQLGCQLIGSTLPWNQAAYLTVRELGGHPNSTVVNYGDAVPAQHAAYVNAVFGQGAELDDYGPGIGAHSGSTVVPVALAVAESECRSGLDFLTSVVIGYDIAARLGVPIHRELHRRGYHSHAVLSTFSTAATAGRLMKLHEDQLVNALAIAGSHAAGTMEYDQSGGEVKRVHSGIAVNAGISSAALARHGLTGPATIFEGERGIFRVLAGIEAPADGLPEVAPGFGVQRASFKLYPTTATQQSPIAVLGALLDDSSTGPDDVSSIDVYLDRLLVKHIGSSAVPHEVIRAQFSLPYSLAIRALYKSNELALYMDPELWSSPRVRALVERIQLHPNSDSVPGKYSCEVRVTLLDGTVLTGRSAQAKGHYLDPLSLVEVQDKFRTLARRVLTSLAADEVIDRVGALDQAPGVADLARLLVRAA